MELNTLSSSVTLVLRSTEHSMAGSGYLAYSKPDKAHIVVLSPFGTTLFEVFALGEQIFIIYPSEKLGFIGHFNELPEKGGLKGLTSIHSVLEDAGGSNSRSQNFGIIEKNGIIEQKQRPDGYKIYYSNHSLVNGVILAHEFDMRNRNDEQLRLTLDEPEVNVIIDNSTFIPRLEGLKIYPLKALEQ